MRALPTLHFMAAAAVFSTIPNHAFAFLNTSPFFIVTSPDISQGGNVPLSSSTALTTTDQFLEIAKDIISQCHSDGYVIATQPGVHASDFRSGNGRIAGTVGVPHLKRALHNVPGNIVVPYARSSVLGHDDADADADGEEGEGSGSLGGQIAVELGEWARDQCGAEMVEVDASTGSFARYGDMKPKVLMVNLGPLDDEDQEERAKALADTDAFLFSLVESFPSKRYTLIYTSTPRTTLIHDPASNLQESHSSPPFPPSAPSVPDELRRRASHPSSPASESSLFQKYAFFSPAIFLGYLTFFFLGTIAFVGLRALLSLKISYAAFEKEMGPAAKKQQ